MAATSPYSPNDYNAVSNFRPYELPVNDIFKGLSAQDAYWKAGAARVKAVYDNALNLKLSLAGNKELRDKYIADSEKQLTKLSSMNLADPSVQRKGMSIFKPLFKDEGIIYDDLATRHYEKVRNDALSYRSRDNGKEYSDINMQYAMQGYQEFINSADRMAGKSAYQNKRDYTPFYDYTDDFSKALKDCKPSSAETQSPLYGKEGATTGYMKESYIKSLSASQARGCLEAGLSGKASRQLQIEGAVTYRNNPKVLGSDVATYLSGVTSNLSDELQRLNAKKAALMKNPNGLTPEQIATINTQIDEQTKSISGELDISNTTIKKINSGDLTDVLNNYEAYAGSVYGYKKIYRKALASAFEDRKELYKADPIQLNAIKFAQDKYLNNLDFNQAVSLEQMKESHDKEMKLLDLMYGGKEPKGTGADIYRNPLTGDVTVNPNLLRETPNIFEKPEKDEKVYSKLMDQVSSLSGQDQSNNLRLYNNLVSRGERDKAFRGTLLKGFNYADSEDDWNRFKADTKNNSFRISKEGNRPGGLQETTWFKAYMAQQPNDEDVNKWSSDYMNINIGINTLNRKIELGERQVAQELGGDFRTQISQGLAQLKPVLSSRGIQITPEDMQQTIEGNSVKGMTIENIKVTRDIGNRGEVERTETVVKVNGVVDGKLTDLYQRVKNKNEDVTSKVKSKRVEVYNKLGFDREAWTFTPNEKAPLVQTIKSILPKSDKGKDADVSIISSDFSGGVKVSVPGVKKGDETYPTLFRNAGIGTSAEATEDGIITLRGTTHNVIQQAINNPIIAQSAALLSSIGETTAYNATQPGAKVPDSDIKVPVVISGKMRELTIETYKDDNGPEFRVYVENSNTSRPIAVASNPYQLFEMINNARIEFSKPVR